MSLPGTKTAGNSVKPRTYTQGNTSQRPDSYHSSLQQSTPSGGSTSKVPNKSGLKLDLGRHSMNIEERVDSILEGKGSAQACDDSKDFIRSQTLSDLHNMALQEQMAACQASGSQSTLTSETSHSGGAKLLHSSHKPQHYTPHHNNTNNNQNTDYGSAGGGQDNRTRDGLGSPIWKPRTPAAAANIPNPLYASISSTTQSRQSSSHYQQPTQPQVLPHSTSTTSSQVYASSAYGNYASIVFDDKNRAVLLTPPRNAMSDTDC